MYLKLRMCIGKLERRQLCEYRKVYLLFSVGIKQHNYFYWLTDSTPAHFPLKIEFLPHNILLEDLFFARFEGDSDLSDAFFFLVPARLELVGDLSEASAEW